MMVAFKKGQKVRWSSQAGGNYDEKEGKIVAVCQKGIVALTQKDKAELIQKHRKCSMKEAARMAKYLNVEGLLGEMYRLKFAPLEGWRDEEHYLVEVCQGKTKKPLLYHPLTKHLRAATK